MKSNESPSVRRRLRATTILAWGLVGVVLGWVFTAQLLDLLEAANPCIGGSECEANAEALAELASPFLGGLWGLIAGVIGYAVASDRPSRKAYTWTMVSVVTLPCLVFVVLGLARSDEIYLGLLLVLLIGIVAWAVAWALSKPLAEGTPG